MNPFLALHRKRGDGIQVEVGVFHSYGANFAAIVGCKIVGRSLRIHTRGVNGAQLPFIGAEKPVGLIDGAHQMKKSRDGWSLFLRRDGVGLGIDGTDETGSG